MKPIKRITKDPSLKATHSPCQKTPVNDDYREGKRHLHFSPKKGETLDVCATIHDSYVCCNVHVLKSVSGCPYECTYCFLQNYLTNTTTTVIDDPDAMIQEVVERAASQPWRFFRIGTWELGDSLALESYTGQAAALVERFAHLPYAVLELKTKSDQVDQILHCEHNGRTVVSWSLNTSDVILKQELKTAPLEMRLMAMKKVVKKGYLIGLHFDPMILHDDWEANYPKLVDQVAECVPANQIAWISIGSLRFNPEMKARMAELYPASNLGAEEMVLGNDGKVRYPKPLRIDMYRTIYRSIRNAFGNAPFVYLCMERWDMWDVVLGYHPTSIGDLDYLMTQDLFKRFPGLVHEEPNADLYREGYSSV